MRVIITIHKYFIKLYKYKKLKYLKNEKKNLSSQLYLKNGTTNEF